MGGLLLVSKVLSMIRDRHGGVGVNMINMAAHFNNDPLCSAAICKLCWAIFRCYYIDPTDCSMVVNSTPLLMKYLCHRVKECIYHKRNLSAEN